MPDEPTFPNWPVIDVAINTMPAPCKYLYAFFCYRPRSPKWLGAGWRLMIFVIIYKKLDVVRQWRIDLGGGRSLFFRHFLDIRPFLHLQDAPVEPLWSRFRRDGPHVGLGSCLRLPT
jgi:hypothetical protein